MPLGPFSAAASYEEWYWHWRKQTLKRQVQHITEAI